MKSCLTHIALQVENLEACLAFYTRVCGMKLVHSREHDEKRIVLLSQGAVKAQASEDYSHLGFALGSREAVDKIADSARQAGCLIWEPRQEPFPVGYYCGLQDPNGNFVEFSYGQPLGPGAESI